ncbi:flagellin [bacterium]
MKINTNVSTLIGLDTGRKNNIDFRKSMERLSSGLKINYAADDPSGQAIAKGMTAQERGITEATHNGEDGINLIRTMDGALSEIHDMLQRMRDLAVKGANEAVLADNDRSKLNNEVSTLSNEITRTAQSVTFNTKQVLAGGSGGAAWEDSTIAGAGAEGSVSMSSDGSMITYYAFAGTSGVYAQGTDGSPPVLLAPATGQTPFISGNGQKVVYVPTLGGNLFSINSDGTNNVQITTDPTGLPGSSFGKCITNDGSKVAYSKLVAGNFDIYASNTDGTGEVQLTTDAGMDGSAIISSNGSKVVFVSWRDGNEEVYVVNSDGTGETRLTSDAGTDAQVSISSDGSKVVFMSTRTGSGEIYSINSDGTGLTQLTSIGGAGQPILTEDGNKIVYRTTNGEVWMMDSDGSNNNMVSDAAVGAGSYELSVSSDGSIVAFRNGTDIVISSSQSQPNVLQIGPDNGDENRIEIEFPDARASALGVSAVSVSSASSAGAAIDTVDAAISTVSDYRANLGITERRIRHVIDDLAATRINVSSARSRIEDADMAAEISGFTRIQILSQTNMASVAQANTQPEVALQLIRAAMG